MVSYSWNPQYLNRLCLECGACQEAIAKACDISISSLLNYLKGKTAPSMDAVIRLADYFAVPTDVILGRASEEDVREIYKDYSRHFMELRKAPYEAYLLRRYNDKLPVDLEEKELDYTVYDAPYPYNLIQEVFQETVLAEMDDSHMAGLEKALSRLSEREKTYLLDMYRDGLNLGDISKKYGLTRERVRQITAKAVRKLRHPYYKQFILLGVDGVAERKEVEDMKESLKRREADLTEREEAVKKTLDAIARFTEKYNVKQGEEEEHHSYIEKEVTYKTDIAELDLSVRAYNCLKRDGINTFGDLVDRAKEGDMLRIRNLGRRSLEEILDKLKYFGYDFYAINLAGQNQIHLARN